VPAYDALGLTLQEQDQPAEAARILQAGLDLMPWHPNMLNNLAWQLATASDEKLRDGAEAVRLAERLAAGPGGSDPSRLDTLAAAYAEAGKFDDAVRTAGRARELAQQAGRNDLAERISQRLNLYERGQPYREP
jgi:tetratricopeptide (TPR) repeat protein